MEKLIRLDSVAVTLGGRRIIDGVDFTLGEGETAAVVGTNGSGKTTLLRVIATLTRPAGGSGEVLGARLGGPVRGPVRRQIGLITHSPGLIEELTLRENLVHFCRVAGVDERGADAALDTVGLGEVSGRVASDSSFGMKRRTEVAWLLLAKPKVLLLDEARSGLDREARKLIDALTRLTVDRGGCVVSASHEVDGLGEGFVTIGRLSQGHLEAAG